MASGDHLPIFGLRKHKVTTNELVFLILSGRHPLTVADIQTEMKQRYGQKLSYQAVRKAVLALAAFGVLEHVKGHGYQLSIEWLLSTRSSIDEILDLYRSPDGPVWYSDAGYQCFHTNSLYETDTLWGDILLSISKRTPKKKRESIISINHYPWWIPMNMGRETVLWEKLMRAGYKVEFIFTRKSPGLAGAAAFYQDIGIPVHYRRSCTIPESHYYNIIGDMVLEVALPDGLVKGISQVFSKAAFEKSSATALSALARRRGSIGISVQNSAPIAAGLLRASA